MKKESFYKWSWAEAMWVPRKDTNKYSYSDGVWIRRISGIKQ